MRSLGDYLAELTLPFGVVLIEHLLQELGVIVVGGKDDGFTNHIAAFHMNTTVFIFA